MGQYVEEFRGTDKLCYAKVLKDNDTDGYVTGEVKILAPVAEISKTVETASDTKFYDNKAALTINAEGADTITVTIPALDLPTLAEITGKDYDADAGAFMDGEATPAYFALGYRLRLTDGSYRYVWRYKGKFAIPDETSQTENAGTDSNNQQLTYTGIETIHTFLKPQKSQKALVLDERTSPTFDFSTFFNTVTTCDMLTGSGMASVTNLLTDAETSNHAGAVALGGTYTATLTAPEGFTLGNVVVIMNGVDVTSTAFTVGTGVISIANVTGNIVIVAVGAANQ